MQGVVCMCLRVCACEHRVCVSGVHAVASKN